MRRGSDVAGIGWQSIDDGGVEAAGGGQDSVDCVIVHHLQDGVGGVNRGRSELECAGEDTGIDICFGQDDSERGQFA